MLEYLTGEKSIVLLNQNFDIFYKTKLGELYCEDCCNIMSSLNSESIDLVVTSPPYDDLRTYENKSEWNWNVFCSIALLLYKVVKQGGVVVWIVNDRTIKGNETGTSFKQALFFKEIGFNLLDTMIWEKSIFKYPELKRYYQIFDYMFVFSKGEHKTYNLIKDRKNKTYNPSDKEYFFQNRRKSDGTIDRKRYKRQKKKPYGVRTNVWKMRPTRSKYNHPAMYPKEIVHDHIISWSNEGDTVLDPMCGSGTTLEMAEYLNRKWIGIDIVKSYCRETVKRIESNKGIKIKRRSLNKQYISDKKNRIRKIIQ